MSERRFTQSPSSEMAFQACPRRYQLGYREGLRSLQDTDAQRIGTNWHELHRVFHTTLSELNTCICPETGTDEACPACIIPAEDFPGIAFDKAVDFLNERYADMTMPASKTLEEWDTERIILAVSLQAYLYHWAEDPINVIVSEQRIELPMHGPRTGMPLPVEQVVRKGFIDHIISWRNMIGIAERKSTSRSIEASSDYWDNVQTSHQVSWYALAIRDMLDAGILPVEVLTHEHFNARQVGNTLYDVWHRPTIKPTALSQKDTKAFLESGEYYGSTFPVEVVREWEESEEKEGGKKKETFKHAEIRVNGDPVEVTPGKKAYAVRENTTMFSARLFHDMTEVRPDFYFQRREIPRSQDQLVRFRKTVFNIYQSTRLMNMHDLWYENWGQCSATFRCQFYAVCRGEGGAEAVCDGKTTPPGFKRIYNPTVEGETLTDTSN